MKSRHWVTLVVFLVAGAALVGIFLRLNAEDDDGTAATGDAATDSVVAAVEGTASAAAFSTEIAIPVEGAAIRRDTFVMWVEATGRAAPRRIAPLHAEVEGSVIEATGREGRYVREGDVLARLDTTVYVLRVRQARGQLERAQAEFQDKILFDDEIQDLEDRAARERLARVRVGLDEREAVLEEAEYELAKTRIVAPFSGRIANMAVDLGSRVNIGDSVATIVDLSQIEIDAEVLHTELPLVAVGRQATVIFAALPGQVFHGRVVSVNPLIDPDSESARVTVRLANPESQIIPGLPGVVRIAGRQLEDRTFVPKVAIVERDRRQVVFVFEPNEPGSETGSAQWKYVTTGLENDTDVEIIPAADGADDTFVPVGGELIIVDGHATLTHDARVRIENYDQIRQEIPAGGRN